MTAEQKIFEYAKNNNLIYGIGTADKFPLMRTLPPVPFAESDIEKRIDPSLTVKNAKSIVCLGLFYNKKFVGIRDGRLRGNISVGAVGMDYHIILKQHLENLMKYAEIEGLCFADTGPLSDRGAALRCGLGYVGKNQSIINEKFGSFFFIGYIITSAILKATPYTQNISCGNCRRCISACPSGAISENGFDYTKCISYLTQSKDINISQAKIMGSNIYGCDVCQKVCIHNTYPPEEITDIDAVYPIIEDIIKMSNSDFKQRFSDTAAGWRGKKIIQRNALISAINSKHSERDNIINLCRSDCRKEISEVIRWLGTQED